MIKVQYFPLLTKSALTSLRGRQFSTANKATLLTPLQIAQEERDFWIQQNSPRFEKDPQTKGPHFLRGSKTPFPLNPLYIPIPPLSHKTKTAIQEAYEVNKTPIPEIAKQYGISVIRAHAVIKLGNIAKQWKENGIPLQHDLQTNMDRLLGAQDRTCEMDTPMEKAKPLTSERLRPMFQFLANDEDALSPIEAAALLNKTPFASVPTMTNKNQIPRTEKIILKDEKERSKYTFVFTDPTNSKMIIREGDGTLREANEKDVYWRDNRKAKFRHCI